VLLDLLVHPPAPRSAAENARRLDMTHPAPTPLEIVQLTGAICPGDDDVYRPGLWIVLRDPHAQPGSPLPHATQDRVAAITAEFVKRLQLA
jgi:hypothetical protein